MSLGHVLDGRLIEIKLFGLKAHGDDNIHIEIERDTAEKRVTDAENFVNRIEEFIKSSRP